MRRLGHFLKFRCVTSAIFAFGFFTGPTNAEPPLIAAASSLRFVLADLQEAFFKTESGSPTRATFGSSGNLMRQITHGAPYTIFLSANNEYPIRLWKEGVTKDQGRVFALGRLALVVPHGQAYDGPPKIEDLRNFFRNESKRRLAIANPEHAPYGVAAAELISNLGIERFPIEHLLVAENVAQAAQFGISGSAFGGLTASSLTTSPEVSERGFITIMPRELHAAIRHRAVLTKRAGPSSTAFLNFLVSEQSRIILERYGFDVPRTE